ncbi:MAG: outer membrane protein assembly factor [Syntrophorhabdus aromaticivorans]|uniref:Translocation and assembly module subunit TamA n=1 Tax=Syntrophorhabdus aromaticivorans TaxID=328301 RepID=A0A351U5U5_9BACT|nr:outer membrane protein assembly factor [Syntrophorhabdus aromaticivorans]HBA55326.1 outer membrane protein assembly factor [Syntrophorhabdus aromaticivorans]
MDRLPALTINVFLIALLCFCVPGTSCSQVKSVVIEITGLSGPEQENVEKALEVPPDLIKEGIADEAWLERLKRQVPQKVRQALEPFGYFSPIVASILEKSDSGTYRLRVGVEPGRPILVTSVTVNVDGEGTLEPAIKKMIAEFPVRQGDRLRQDIYEAAKANLEKKTISLGYLDAFYSEHSIRVSLQELSASINLVLKTGRQYRFGPVSFTGNPNYPEAFLQRYLAFKPGQVFSQEKLARTQSNLAGTDRFKVVTVRGAKEAAVDDAVPVEIGLTPSPPKRLKFGIGYGTDTGLRGTVRYQDLNIGHRGHGLDTELKVSEIFQGLGVRYVFPAMIDMKSLSSLKLGFEREDTTDKLVEYVLVEGEHTRTIGRDVIGSIFVRLQQEDSKAGDQITRSFLLMPGVRLSGHRYNDLIRPTRGFRYDLEARGTDRSMGSGTSFLQFLGSGELVVPLPQRIFLITRMRFGTTTAHEPAEDLPISVRFFAGGDNSVRGYAYQSLGPEDADGKVVGGRHMIAGTMEAEKAVGKNWGIVVFYDTGSAFNNWSNIDAAQGAGIGGRYYTPVGPVRLDLARQIGVRDPDYRIHITMGLDL